MNSTITELNFYKFIYTYKYCSIYELNEKKKTITMNNNNNNNNKFPTNLKCTVMFVYNVIV